MTHLNKSKRKMCGRKNTITYTDDEILPFAFYTQYFKLLYAAFLFWPSICKYVLERRMVDKR